MPAPKPATARSKARSSPPPPLPLGWRSATAAVAVGVAAVLPAEARAVCFPGLHCHGCPAAATACPAGALAYGASQQALPLLALGSTLAVGAVAGRHACGWLCPFGLLQDLMHRIPGPKLRLPRWTRWLPLTVLALLVFALPWLIGFSNGPQAELRELRDDATLQLVNSGEAVLPSAEVSLRWLDATGAVVWQGVVAAEALDLAPGDEHLLRLALPPDLPPGQLEIATAQGWFVHEPRSWAYVCSLCPAGTLTAAIPVRLADSSGLDWGSWLASRAPRLLVLLAFLIGIWLVARFFCRTACPLGALWGLMARSGVIRLRLDQKLCTNCGACRRSCPLELDPTRELSGPGCIACGACVSACSRKGIRLGVAN